MFTIQNVNFLIKIRLLDINKCYCVQQKCFS